MNWRARMALFGATAGYAGYVPFAPGTIGSLWGVPVGWFLSGLSLPAGLGGLALLVLLAVWIAHKAEQVLEVKDPGVIVIDEVAGMAVCLWGLPLNLFGLVAAFGVFRAFDIAKPFPIRLLDRRLSGGLGIVADDLLAGIFGQGVLRLLIALGVPLAGG